MHKGRTLLFFTKLKCVQDTLLKFTLWYQFYSRLSFLELNKLLKKKKTHILIITESMTQLLAFRCIIKKKPLTLKLYFWQNNGFLKYHSYNFQNVVPNDAFNRFGYGMSLNSKPSIHKCVIFFMKPYFIF